MAALVMEDVTMISPIPISSGVHVRTLLYRHFTKAAGSRFCGNVDRADAFEYLEVG
jgi:hypothetical protein